MIGARCRVCISVSVCSILAVYCLVSEKWCLKVNTEKEMVLFVLCEVTLDHAPRVPPKVIVAQCSVHDSAAWHSMAYAILLPTLYLWLVLHSQRPHQVLVQMLYTHVISTVSFLQLSQEAFAVIAERHDFSPLYGLFVLVCRPVNVMCGPHVLLVTFSALSVQYIYISTEEMMAVAEYIKKRGRIAIAELAAKSNTFIDLEAKATAVSALAGITHHVKLPQPAATCFCPCFEG